VSLRLVFMGTPDFAVPMLRRLAADGYDIAAVYCQPPRQAGRGMAERPSPVHQAALDLGLEVRTPLNFKNQADIDAFAALEADAAVVVAYGLLLPKAILEAPRHGAYNMHASKLPRWRGAAPIQRAIMAGDKVTAATVMRMDEGLDTGPVCAERDVAITPGMTAGELHDRLAGAGTDLMAEAMARLDRDGRLDCRPQPGEGATYAAKIDKAEARIDFARPAADVLNHIHGLSPFPGAWFEVDTGRGAQRVKLLRAETAAGSGVSGAVLDDRLAIACADGAIRPLWLQRQGKGAMALDDFLRGTAIAPGTMLAG